ncbi:hypothetical protein [Brevibacterium sediminis]|uniref:hypothetical protein n=1 Tax=Brevibacterium sediminis TaxID=1857024 RepID=UPI003B3A19B8
MSNNLDGRSETPVDRLRVAELQTRMDEADSYSVIDDREAAAFELRLAGDVVATLHYTLDEENQQAVFVCCEIEETLAAAQHCRVLLTTAIEAVESRGMSVSVTWPVALKVREVSH